MWDRSGAAGHFGGKLCLARARQEESRRACENDRWRPPDLDDTDAPPVSSRGQAREVMPEYLEQERRIWLELGYKGDDL